MKIDIKKLKMKIDIKKLKMKIKYSMSRFKSNIQCPVSVQIFNVLSQFKYSMIEGGGWCKINHRVMIRDD